MKKLVAVGLAVVAAFAVSAADFEWTGGGDKTSWSDPLNWKVTDGEDEDGIPDGDDDIVFPDALQGTGAIAVSFGGEDRACNSLLWQVGNKDNGYGLTLGEAGTKLSVTTGPFGFQNDSFNAPCRINCDLDFPNEGETEFRLRINSITADDGGNCKTLLG